MLKSNTYIDLDLENNDKDPKFKAGENVRISKYKNIFENVINQIGKKKFLLLKTLNILYHGHMQWNTWMEKK